VNGPPLRLLCGFPNGKRHAPHGKFLDAVWMKDGRIVGGSVGPGRINGERWLLVVRTCPKHGALMVRERDVIVALRRRQPALMLTERSVLKVRRRPSHTVAKRGASVEPD
jgi:hypothetical protein